LFFAIFATVTGVGLVVPLLPIYARELGASGFAIGLIFGSFSISRTAFIPYFGRLSDRKGRKPLIVPGLLAYALISLAFVATTSVTGLIIVRFFQGIASSALMPVIQAYVGDITPPGREGSTMGLFNLSMFLGLSLGPLIGGTIQDNFGIQAAFYGMALLAFIGFLLVAAFLPPTAQEKVVRSARPVGPWKDLIYDREILSLSLVRLAYTFSIGILWSFLPVWADSHLALSGSAIGVVITVGVLVSGVMQLPMGAVADRTSKRGLILAGGVIVAAAMTAFECMEGFGGLVLINLLFGIGGGVLMPALMAMALHKGAQKAALGSVMAILTVAHSAGMLGGAVLAGIMMDAFGLQAVFPLGAGFVFVCAVAFYLGTLPRKAVDPCDASGGRDGRI
jgi:MFS family permease